MIATLAELFETVPKAGEGNWRSVALTENVYVVPSVSPVNVIVLVVEGSVVIAPPTVTLQLPPVSPVSVNVAVNAPGTVPKVTATSAALDVTTREFRAAG